MVKYKRDEFNLPVLICFGAGVYRADRVGLGGVSTKKR
jgi:hypothetical protein